MFNSALLVLEDGTQFQGRAIGATGLAVGEVVFNTAMTGYQEVLTDPSYAQQIVTLTAPHIGNVGINSVDEESPSIYAKGLVIRDLSPIASNFRSQNGLSEYLKAHNVVAISEVDTRKLTRLLRDQGAQNGCIMAGEQDVETALANIRLFAGLKGVDLAKTVTTGKIYQWSQRFVDSKLSPSVAVPMFPYKVVVYDFGVKQRILQMLAERGCQLTVVPARTSAQTVLDMAPDGVFLSNGPGDPAACDYAISAIQQLLVASIPMFGICLGHQLLALACGATTQKMKFGHHGANHPVKDLMRNRVMITAQNHGFVVDAKTLPITLRVTHQSLFDGTLQGIQHIEKPAFSFQGHPEASPGPQDAARLFDDFIELMAQYQKQAHFHALGA